MAPDDGMGTFLAGYRRLLDLFRDLASTLDLDVLLNRIVHAAADFSDSEACSIMLYDESRQQLYFQTATNLDKPLMRGLQVPVEGSIAGWIFTNRKPIIVSDVRNDPRHFVRIEESTEFKTRSILGVPLITKDKVIGVLEAINKRSGEFTREDEELLMTLGAQAAVAIENARLFQQSDLIAEFVHELRTPLASLNTAAHLLMRTEISEEQRRKMAEVIQRETLRLSEMASSFLDLARLESGRTRFNLEEIDLRALLQECAGIVALKIDELDLIFETDIPDELPTFEGDRDKLKQVILNLLSNAYKYNRPRGHVRLAARLDKNAVVIEVADTGRGIPEEDLAHLFEKFFRVPGTEKIADGTGLGLSISKRIVDAHGGRIEVHSQIGQGTTFRVYLPIEMKREPPSVTTEQAAKAP